jgi:cytochrome P450
MADTTVGSYPVRGGEMVLLSFPAANRDPDKFAGPDRVIIDRVDILMWHLGSAFIGASGPTWREWRCGLHWRSG